MVTLSDARIDELIAEDVPYIDLTSHILGIDAQAGAMEYFTREACVLAGGEVASRIATKLGCVVTNILPDGTSLEAGQSFMTIGGTASQLHQAWKVCLNVFDHLSAVATKTRMMVDAAHAANPSCEILTTRKSMPGVKDLLVEATIAGGAFPHRLGLSETVLVFDHHLSFMGGNRRVHRTATPNPFTLHREEVVRRGERRTGARPRMAQRRLHARLRRLVRDRCLGRHRRRPAR